MRIQEKLVRDYVARFNEGNLDGLRTLFTSDAEIHGVLGWGGIDEVMPIWRQLVDCLGIQLEIVDLVVEGDKVAARYRETGESRAPFLDQPATGKRYELVAMEWFEIEGDKIRRRWGARDAASQAAQLGWMTAPSRNK